MEKNVEEKPINWVILRRGVLVYIGNGKSNYDRKVDCESNVMFDYETVEIVSDNQLFELQNKSEYFNPQL